MKVPEIRYKDIEIKPRDVSQSGTKQPKSDDYLNRILPNNGGAPPKTNDSFEKTPKKPPQNENYSDIGKTPLAFVPETKEKPRETDKTREKANESAAKVKEELTSSERKLVQNLKRIDQAVKAHESAHRAAGGGLVRGGDYVYTVGPDGNRYAVSGEVKIDMSYDLDNPEEVIRKMQQIRRAALAPADPSAQDRAVAASASSIEARARAELQGQRNENISQRIQGDFSPARAYEEQQNRATEKGSLVNLIK